MSVSPSSKEYLIISGKGTCPSHCTASTIKPIVGSYRHPKAPFKYYICKMLGFFLPPPQPTWASCGSHMGPMWLLKKVMLKENKLFFNFLGGDRGKEKYIFKSLNLWDFINYLFQEITHIQLPTPIWVPCGSQLGKSHVKQFQKTQLAHMGPSWVLYGPHGTHLAHLKPIWGPLILLAGNVV